MKEPTDEPIEECPECGGTEISVEQLRRLASGSKAHA